MTGQEQTLIKIDDWVVLVTFWSALVFPLFVASFWKWWDTSFGRSFMSLDILLWGALLPSAVRRMFDINIMSLGFIWLYTVVFFLLTPSMVWRAWVLLQEQRQGRPYREIWAWNYWSFRWPSLRRKGKS